MYDKSSRWQSVFVKYLFSYIVLLMLPVLIISVFFITEFIDVLKKEVIINDSHILLQISERIDEEFADMLHDSSTFPFNYNLNGYFLNNDPFKRLEGIKTLREKRSANAFIDDIMLFFDCNLEVYGASTIYSLTHGSNNYFFDYIQCSEDEFAWDISEIKIPTAKPYNGVIHYYIPNSSYLKIIYLIDKDNIYDTIRNKDENTAMDMFIFNRNRQNLIMTDNSISRDTGFMELINRIDGNGWEMIHINGTRYLASYRVSQITGWLYVKVTSFNDVMNKLTGIILQFAWYMAVIVLIGIVFIVFCMCMNYKPLANLKNKVETYLHTKLIKSNVQSISSAIEDVFISNNKLLTELVSIKTVLKKHFLKNVFSGQIEGPEEFKAIAKELGFKEVYSRYRVVIVHFELQNNESSETIIQAHEKLCRTFSDTFISKNDVNVFNLYIKEKTVFLLNYDNMAETDLKKHIKQFIEQIDFKSIKVVCGTECNNINKIGKTLLYANITVNSAIQQTDSVVFADEENEKLMNIWDINKWLSELDLRLKENNVSKAKTLVNKMFEEVSNKTADPLVIKCVCFDIIHTIFRVARELSLYSIEHQISYMDIVMLSETNDVDTFKNELYCIIDNIAACFSDTQSKNKEEMMKKIVNYINENYHNYNLSINEIADKMGYSYKYLSRYFKETTGYNLSDYIARVRVDKFKELSHMTDASLEELVKKVGYGTVASFTRKFKQIEGISPYKYKKFTYKTGQ